MTRNVVEIARELIKIPSVNPMGHEEDRSVAVEEGVTQYLIDFFESRGLSDVRWVVGSGGGLNKINVVVGHPVR